MMGEELKERRSKECNRKSIVMVITVTIVFLPAGVEIKTGCYQSRAIAKILVSAPVGRNTTITIINIILLLLLH